MLGGVCLHAGTIPSKTLRWPSSTSRAFEQKSFYGQAYSPDRQHVTVDDLMFRVRTVIEREHAQVTDQLQRNGVTQDHGRRNLGLGDRFVDIPRSMIVVSAVVIGLAVCRCSPPWVGASSSSNPCGTMPGFLDKQIIEALRYHTLVVLTSRCGKGQLLTVPLTRPAGRLSRTSNTYRYAFPA